MPSELLLAQTRFLSLVPKLLERIALMGYHATFGDAWAKEGHAYNSCHYIRLAIDLNLFDKDYHYLEDTETHRPFGEFWKTLDPGCRWGGNFRKPDGNHYSFTYQGRA
jgi:hypothetical protein